MNQPTFDKEGSPSEETLQRLESWPLPFEGLLDFVEEVWNDTYGKMTWDEEGRLELVTGGWSGNESIILALQNNKNYFWTHYWYQSQRGGLHVLDKPITQEGKV